MCSLRVRMRMQREKKRLLVKAARSAVEKAVLQLTKLVTTMSKRKKRVGTGLESILDKTEAAGSGEASSSSHGSRSKAAAYVKLKAALTEKRSGSIRASKSGLKKILEL